MSVSGRFCTAIGFAFLLQAQLGVAQTKVIIRTHDDAEYRGAVTIAVAGSNPVSVDYRGTEKTLEIGQLLIPAAVKQITLSGKITRTRKGRSLTSVGKTSIPIVDVAPLLDTLRTADPWWTRLTQFQKQRAAFEKSIEELVSEGQLSLTEGTRSTRAALATANRRLGFELPAEHADVLEKFGAWRFEDSFATPSEQLARALDQLVTVWETPRNSVQQLPDKTRSFLQSSTILFTLAGDGYEGILYQPPAAGEPNSKGRYYRVHEGSLVEPRLLQTADGKPMDYSQVMQSWIASELNQRYGGSGEILMLDRRAAAPAVYSLTLTPQGTELGLALSWEPEGR